MSFLIKILEFFGFQQSALLEPDERVKLLLEQFVEVIDVVGEPGRPAWIFRQGVPAKTASYARTISTWIENARSEGRQEGYERGARTGNWTCVCRCRAHGRSACPKCLNVFGCPVHHEVGPDHLRPDVLKDAGALAKLVHATYQEVCDECAFEAPIAMPDWDQNPEHYQLAMIETMRRAICARLINK